VVVSHEVVVLAS
jgi:3-oxoacyl-[acyl-carrier-protein] synthase III